MIIQMLKNKQGKWLFHIKAENGKILCHSESYSSKAKCMYTIKLFLNNPKFSFITDVKVKFPI